MRPAIGIALAVGLQTLTLVGMIGGQQYTLNQGTPVLLETEPVDPRSLFRGDYVILDYAISELPASMPGGEREWRRFERIYVVLEPGDTYWQAVSMHTERPNVALGQVAIKAEVRRIRAVGGGRATTDRNRKIQVRYGVETYFVPEGEGRAIERPAEGETVDIQAAVDRFGNAAIKAVLLNGEPLYEESLFR